MAFIRNVDKLIEGLENKFFTEQRAKDALAPELAAEEAAREAGDSAEAAARQSADNALSGRLDVIEGSGEGSVAKAEQDAKDYADQKVAALVNSAPEVLDTLKELSDALGGDENFATTVANNIGAVDAKVDQEILDRQSAVSAEQSARESADSALSGRLDSLEADSVTKAYVDGEVLDLQGQITQEISDRQAAVEAEEDARQLADSNLSDRIGVLEQDPTTKAYVDGEVLDLQGQLTQEISDRQADVDAEETRAMSAESALSGRLDVLEQDPTTKAYVDQEVSAEESRAMLAEQGLQSDIDAEEVRAMAAESALDVRLDVLEQDPTTKTYVDGEVSDLQGQITQEIADRQSAVSTEQSRAVAAEEALDARLDVLEADPVTKSYVDSQDSGLQGQINTEKGRIDAILSASEADKDSFAEIVQLINSVDTENDSAFASYVLSNDAALAQEVSDREAAVSAEETARMAADSALDAKIDLDLLDFGKYSLVSSIITNFSEITELVIVTTDNQPITLDPNGNNLNVSLEESYIVYSGDATHYPLLSVNGNMANSNGLSAGSGDFNLGFGFEHPTGFTQISFMPQEVSIMTDEGNSSISRAAGYTIFQHSTVAVYTSLGEALKQETELRTALNVSLTEESIAREAADVGLQDNISAEANARSAEDLTMFKKNGSRNLEGHLKFSTEVFDIGASGANRPNNIYVKNSIVNAGSESIGTTLTMAGASGAHMVWGTDGAGNIGINNGNRPNYIYVKAGIVNAGTQMMSAASGANLRWTTDGAGDIGAASANRPNNVYVKNTAKATILIADNGFTNNGGLTVKYTQKATDYTATLTDHIIAVSDLSVSRVITLPSAWSGVVYIIKDQTGAASETNYIQISPPSGKFIDGESDYKIKAPYESVMLVTDGTNWFII